MSVLVRGMKMPNRCLDCPLMVSRYNDECIVQSEAVNEIARTWDDLKANCPLIDVPTQHGRLIDADFEERHYTSMTVNPTPDVTEKDKRNSLVIIEALQMAKTIIEAEGSDT